MLPNFLSPPTGEKRNSRTETKEKSQIVSRALSQNRQEAVTTILGKSLVFFFCIVLVSIHAILQLILKNNLLLLNYKALKPFQIQIEILFNSQIIFT